MPVDRSGFVKSFVADIVSVSFRSFLSGSKQGIHASPSAKLLVLAVGSVSHIALNLKVGSNQSQVPCQQMSILMHILCNNMQHILNLAFLERKFVKKD